MRCHSVCSFFSPSFEVQFSVVAMLKLATDWPPGVTRTSASLPRLPIKITLFTLPMSRPLHPRIQVVVHVISCVGYPIILLRRDRWGHAFALRAKAGQAF